MKKSTHLVRSSSAGSMLALVIAAALPGAAFGDTWHLGVPMPTARNDCPAILGPDGKIYVIGGETDGNIRTAVVERFDEAAQQWESVASLPVPTGGAAVAKDKAGRIWLFGGRTTSVWETTNAVYRYDLPHDQWLREGTMPNKRRGACAVTDSQGLIYLIGGDEGPDKFSVLVERFDPTLGTWSDLPSLNVPRANHGAFLDGNNRIFVVAGARGDFGLVQCLDLGNLAAGWVSKAPLPSPRQTQGTLGADGLFYVVGGWNGWFVSAVDRYDPVSDTWSTYAPLNYGNNTMAIVTGSSGRIYSIGGESSPMVKTPRVEYTDPYPLRDTVPPQITCPEDIMVPTEPGQCAAVVLYPEPSATDNRPGVVVVCTPPSGANFLQGMTTVACTATDASGNTASCSFTVTVNDTEFPTITCPADIAVGCSADLLVPVSFSATATDNCELAPAVTCSPSSGSGFAVGTTPVTCTATDLSGNQASCSFQVTRAPLSFTGFLPPIGGADVTGGTSVAPLKTFKMNSTIPVKFTAACHGSAVLTGVHRLQVVKYTDDTTSEQPIDATPQDAATTGNEFRLIDGQWHFNLDTRATGLSVGKWHVIALLSDGSKHSAWIQIK